MPRHAISKTRNNPDANIAKYNIKYIKESKDNISKIIKVNNE